MSISDPKQDAQNPNFATCLHFDRLTLDITPEKAGETRVAIKIAGQLPEGNLEILIPQNGHKLREVVDEQKHRLPVIWEAEGLTNVAGIRIPMRSSLGLVFR